MRSVRKTRLGGQVRELHYRLDFHLQPEKRSLSPEGNLSWSPLQQGHTCRCVWLIVALHAIHNSHWAGRLVLPLFPVARRSKFGQPCRLHARYQAKKQRLVKAAIYLPSLLCLTYPIAKKAQHLAGLKS